MAAWRLSRRVPSGTTGASPADLRLFAADLRLFAAAPARFDTRTGFDTRDAVDT